MNQNTGSSIRHVAVVLLFCSFAGSAGSGEEAPPPFVIGRLAGTGLGSGSAAGVSTAPPTAVILTLPRAAQPPVLDGHIQAGEWDHAAALTGLLGQGQKLASRQSVFFIMWQPDAVWIAARTFFLPGVKVMKRDSPAQSDTLELGVFAGDVSDRDAVLSHFFVFPDAAPVELEAYSPFSHEFIRANVPPGASIQTASRVGPDPEQTLGAGTQRWEAEIRVPLAALMREQPLCNGETLRLLLCRNYGTQLEQTYIPVLRGFFDPTGFVHARLVEAEPVTRFTDIRPLVNGMGALALRVEQAAGHAETLTARHGFGTNAPASATAVALPADGGQPVELGKPAAEQGVFTVEISDPRGAPLFRFLAPFARQAMAVAARTDELPRLNRLVYAQSEGLFLLRRQPSGVESLVRLTYRQSRGSMPRLSPDGNQILLTSNEGGTNGVWLLEEEGRRQRRLVDGRDASWLPDGSGIVFERDGRLFRRLLNASGPGVEVEITPRRTAACRYPVVSPAAPHFLAFVVNGRTLCRSNPDGTEMKTLADGDMASAPAWSPDGTRLAFQDGPHLWVVNASGQRCLAAGGVGIKSDPVWEANGRALAACFRPSRAAAREWRAFPLGATDLTTSRPLLPGVESPVDGAWQFDTAPEAKMAALPPVTTGDVSLAEGIRLAGDATVMRECVSRTVTGCRIAGLKQGRALTLSGPLTQLLLVDRLGRDLRVEPAGKPVSLDFAPLLICPAADGQRLLAIANPTARASITATWSDNRWTLAFQGGPGPVGIGVAEGEGAAIWQDPSRAAEKEAAPADGQWRFIGGEQDAPAAFRGTPKALPDARLRYFFARTAQSPLRGFAVSDVVGDLCGVTGAESEVVLQEDSALAYDVAKVKTLYPTLGLCLDAIEQASRSDQLPYMDKDIPRWCDDAEAILAAMDARLDAFAEGARTFALTDPAQLAAARAGFVTPAALREARAGMEGGAKFDAKPYLERGRKALKEREEWLGRCRAGAVACRVAATQDCLSAPDADARTKAEERWRSVGNLLSHRHLAEGRWLGETPTLPLMMPFWKDNLWGW